MLRVQLRRNKSSSDADILKHTCTRTVGSDGCDVSWLVDTRCLAVIGREEVVCVALATAVVELAAGGRARVVVPSDLIREARSDVDRLQTVVCCVAVRYEPN